MKKQTKRNLILAAEAVVGAGAAYLAVGECQLLIPMVLCAVLMLVLPTARIFEVMDETERFKKTNK